MVGARLGALEPLIAPRHIKSATRAENPAFTEKDTEKTPSRALTVRDLSRAFKEFEYPPVYENAPGESPQFITEPVAEGDAPILLFRADKELIKKRETTDIALKDLFSAFDKCLHQIGFFKPRYGVRAQDSGFAKELQEAGVYDYLNEKLSSLDRLQKARLLPSRPLSLEKERGTFVEELASADFSLVLRKVREALRRKEGSAGSLRYTRPLDSAVSAAKAAFSDEISMREDLYSARIKINALREREAAKIFSDNKAPGYDAALYDIQKRYKTATALMDSIQIKLSAPLDEVEEKIIALRGKKDPPSLAVLEVRKNIRGLRDVYTEKKQAVEDGLERLKGSNRVSREKLRARAAALSVKNDLLSPDEFFVRVYPKALNSAEAVFRRRVEELVDLRAACYDASASLSTQVSYLSALVRFFQACSIEYTDGEGNDELQGFADEANSLRDQLSHTEGLDIYARKALTDRVAKLRGDLDELASVTELYFSDTEAGVGGKPHSKIARGSFSELRRPGAFVSAQEEYADKVKRSARDAIYLCDYIEDEAASIYMREIGERFNLPETILRDSSVIYYLTLKYAIDSEFKKEEFSPDDEEKFLEAPSSLRAQITDAVIEAFAKELDIRIMQRKDIREGGTFGAIVTTSDSEGGGEGSLSEDDLSGREEYQDKDEDKDADEIASELKLSDAAGSAIVFVSVSGTPGFNAPANSVLALCASSITVPYPPKVAGVDLAVPSLIATYYGVLKAQTALACAKYAFVRGNIKKVMMVTDTTKTILDIVAATETALKSAADATRQDIDAFSEILLADKDQARIALNNTLDRYLEILQGIREDADSFIAERSTPGPFIKSISELSSSVTKYSRRGSGLSATILSPSDIDASVNKITRAYKGDGKIRPLTIRAVIAAALLQNTFSGDVYRILVSILKDKEKAQTLLQEFSEWAFLGSSPGIMGYKEHDSDKAKPASESFRNWMVRQAQLRRSRADREGIKKIAVSSVIDVLVIKAPKQDIGVPLYTEKVKEYSRDTGYGSEESAEAVKASEFLPLTEKNLIIYGVRRVLEKAGKDAGDSAVLAELASIRKDTQRREYINAGYASVRDNIFIAESFDYSGSPENFRKIPEKYLPQNLPVKNKEETGVISQEIAPLQDENKPKTAYRVYISTPAIYTPESLAVYTDGVAEIPEETAENEIIRKMLTTFLKVVRPERRAVESGGIRGYDSDASEDDFEDATPGEIAAGDVEGGGGSAFSEGGDFFEQALLAEALSDDSSGLSSRDPYVRLVSNTLILLAGAAEAGLGSFGYDLPRAVLLYKLELYLISNPDLPLLQAVVEDKKNENAKKAAEEKAKKANKAEETEETEVAGARLVIGPDIIKRYIEALSKNSATAREADLYRDPDTKAFPSKDKIRDLLRDVKKEILHVWKAWLDKKYPNNEAFVFYETDSKTDAPKSIALAIFRESTKYEKYNEKSSYKKRRKVESFEHPEARMEKYKVVSLPGAVYYLVETPHDPDRYSARGEGASLPSIDNMLVTLRLVTQSALAPIKVSNNNLQIMVKEAAHSKKDVSKPRFCLASPISKSYLSAPILYDRAKDVFANLSIEPPSGERDRQELEQNITRSIRFEDFKPIAARRAKTLLDGVLTELLDDIGTPVQAKKEAIYKALSESQKYIKNRQDEAKEMLFDLARQERQLDSDILGMTRRRGIVSDIEGEIIDRDIAEAEDNRAQVRELIKYAEEAVRDSEQLGYY